MSGDATDLGFPRDFGEPRAFPKYSCFVQRSGAFEVLAQEITGGHGLGINASFSLVGGKK